ncbi:MULTISPECIES: GNAT family N-acetyltransferase [unclassified Streptomyces]|uniref:GNAT family N-acetyltransferase n=1 Tax=unclassified Streptomyces TaxID=2593676 RepID=UPI003332D8F8
MHPAEAEDDVEACLRVLAEVHRHDGYPLNWPAQRGAWLSDGPLLGSWVAELDGRPVGHIGLSHAAAGDSAPALWSGRTGAPPEAASVVTRLFVSPGARGHSLGALLIGRAVQEAQRHGLHPVLDVLSGDAAAAATSLSAPSSTMTALASSPVSSFRRVSVTASRSTLRKSSASMSMSDPTPCRGHGSPRPYLPAVAGPGIPSGACFSTPRCPSRHPRSGGPVSALGPDIEETRTLARFGDFSPYRCPRIAGAVCEAFARGTSQPTADTRRPRRRLRVSAA